MSTIIKLNSKLWLRFQSYIVKLSTTICMLGCFNQVLYIVVDLEKLSFNTLTNYLISKLYLLHCNVYVISDELCRSLAYLRTSHITQ